jgi:hypothetical protein
MRLVVTAQTVGHTFRHLNLSLLEVSFMVGLSFIARYLEVDAALGLSLTHRCFETYPGTDMLGQSYCDLRF